MTAPLALAAEPPAIGMPPRDVAHADEGDLELHSVTTILGVLDKPALLGWAAKEAALAAITSLDTLASRVDVEGPGEVVRWLSGARFRPNPGELRATDLGNAVHAAVEQYALTGRRPGLGELGDIVRSLGGEKFTGVAAETAVVAHMVDRFEEWTQRAQPVYAATEVVVYNLTRGYAGMADAFLSLDGLPLVVDYKTSREPYDSKGQPKRPYPDWALQVTAYRHAERAAVWRARRTEQFRRRVYLLSEAERDLSVPVPPTSGGLIIMITPKWCEAFPVACDARMYEAFGFVQEVYRWSHGLALSAVGQPLVYTP